MCFIQEDGIYRTSLFPQLSKVQSEINIIMDGLLLKRLEKIQVSAD